MKVQVLQHRKPTHVEKRRSPVLDRASDFILRADAMLRGHVFTQQMLARREAEWQKKERDYAARNGTDRD